MRGDKEIFHDILGLCEEAYDNARTKLNEHDPAINDEVETGALFENLVARITFWHARLLETTDRYNTLLPGE